MHQTARLRWVVDLCHGLAFARLAACDCVEGGRLGFHTTVHRFTPYLTIRSLVMGAET